MPERRGIPPRSKSIDKSCDRGLDDLDDIARRDRSIM
jgi:hypothetical protein